MTNNISDNFKQKAKKASPVMSDKTRNLVDNITAALVGLVFGTAWFLFIIFMWYLAVIAFFTIIIGIFILIFHVH